MNTALENLKKEVNDLVFSFFGAAGKGSKFTAKMDEIFAKVQNEIKTAEEEDHGGRQD